MGIAVWALIAYIAVIVVWNGLLKRNIGEAMLIGFVAVCLFGGTGFLGLARAGIADALAEEVVFAALAFVFMAPLVWMVTASLKPETQVMAIPPTFLPRHFQWQNYVDAWGSIQGFLFNSVKLAVLSVGGTLFISSLAAFAWAGAIMWKLALPMAAGQLVGSWVGAHLTVRKGRTLVRYAVVAVSLVLLGRLAWQFWFA